MKHVGVAMVIVGVVGVAVFLGGYLQSFLRTPWAQPLKWLSIDKRKKEEALNRYRETNASWRPKFAFGLVASLALGVAGVVLVAIG